MALTKEQWADREKTTLDAFLDDLDIMDGYPENEHLARKIIEKLQRLYGLINFS